MDCNSLALFTSAFIFFITLFLVAKQWIGFSLTLVLLLFTLASGLVISNQNIIQEYIKGSPDEHIYDVDAKVSHFQEQMLKAYDSLRADLEIQKHKLQALEDKQKE